MYRSSQATTFDACCTPPERVGSLDSNAVPSSCGCREVKAGVMSPASWQRILFYILVYLLWVVNVVVCTATIIEFRSTVNAFWLITGHSFETLGLANQLILLLGGLVVLVYVLFLESYYRRCVAQLYALLRRFAWTTAIPISVLLGSLVIRHIALSFSH